MIYQLVTMLEQWLPRSQPGRTMAEDDWLPTASATGLLDGGEAMISVEGTTLVDRPVGEVWNFIAEVSNTPKWDTGIVEAVRTSDGPDGVGMTVRALSRVGSREQVLNVVVSEYEPGRSLGLRFDTKFGKVRVHHGFEATGAQTKLTKTTEMWPTGFFRLIQPIIRRRLQKIEIEVDLGNVKRLLETEGS